MTDHSLHANTDARSLDLLPWADPYIMQLFAEAEVLETVDDTESVTCRDKPELPAGEKATSEAVFRSDSWTIRPLRRSAVSRTRRTGSEHLLARC